MTTISPALRINVTAKAGLVLRRYAPLLILIALLALFSVISPNFMTFANLRLMLRQVSFAAISAVGIMFVMISGGIDLSIGSQIIFTNIVLAIMMSSGYGYQLDPLIAIPLCIAMGTVLGMVNGLLSITLNIHSLIITLGTAMIYKGLGYIVADAKNISGLPDSFRVWGQGYLGPVPVPIVIMAVVAIVGAFVLSKTYFGRYVYALGGNEEAARLAGVNVNRMKIAVFAICGFASGLTSVLLLSRVFNGQVSTGAGIEFDSLTAALLGGVSFKGGEGTILGLITGVLIIGVLNNGMQLFGLQDFYQNLVKGAVLLAAVGFDTYQKSRKARETVQKVAA
ncbi:MAG: ABC transporter permease [Anaerolineae bacterium]|nr:ABC transporter permease [Anaerolineae bacterium]